MKAVHLQNTDHAVSEERICAIYVDRQGFMGGAKTFRDIDTNPLIKGDRRVHDPKTVSRIIGTFQYIAHNSFLGTTMDEKQIASIASNPMSDIMGGHTDGGMFSNGSFFSMSSTGWDVPRVAQYVETIMAPGTNNEIRGWIFFFVAVDPSFSFNTALVNLFSVANLHAIARAKKQSKSGGARTNPMDLYFCPYTNLSSWFREAVYMYHRFGMDTNQTCRAMSSPLTNTSPIALHRVFSVERAMEWVSFFGELQGHPAFTHTHIIGDAQTFGGGTFGEDGGGGGGEEDLFAAVDGPLYKLRFHRRAYEVPALKKPPSVFLGILFEEIYEPQVEPMGETQQEQYFRLRDEFGRAYQVQAPTTNLQSVKTLIQEMKRDGKTQEELIQWAMTPQADRLIQSVLSSDEECPANVAVYAYYKKKEALGPVVMVTPVKELPDKNLTFMGNMCARNMLKIHEYSGIINLHIEMDLLITVSFLSADIEGHGELIVHVIMIGPPSAGKSYLISVVKHCLITGTYESVAVQTAMAMTTEENKNGKTKFCDELPPSFTNVGDGQGLGHLKTAMTAGMVEVEQCHIDPQTGRRLMVKVKSYQHGAYICGSNVGAFNLPEPIESRSAIIGVPLRKSERDPIAELFSAADDPTLRENKLAMCDEWQRRQFIVSILYTWIRLGIIPCVHSFVPAMMIRTIREVLEHAGYAQDPRAFHRLMNIVGGVTMIDAVNRVFFTSDFFEEGTPFKFSHVLECSRFLVSTHEHLWYALGLMFPSMVMPLQDTILEAIWTLIHEQKGLDQFSKIRKGQDYVPDFDYFVVSLDGSSSSAGTPGSSSALNAVVDMVINVIKRGDEVLSPDNVKDVLHWMIKGGTFESHYKFTDEMTWVPREGGSASIPKLKIREFANPRGLAISREFLERMTDRNGKILPTMSTRGILHRCIEATMPDGVKETTKFVTGMSLRDQGNPHLCDVFSAKLAAENRVFAETETNAKNLAFSGNNPSTMIVNETIVAQQKEQAKKKATGMKDPSKMSHGDLHEYYLEVGMKAWTSEDAKHFFLRRHAFPENCPDHMSQEEFEDHVWSNRFHIKEDFIRRASQRHANPEAVWNAFYQNQRMVDARNLGRAIVRKRLEHAKDTLSDIDKNLINWVRAQCRVAWIRQAQCLSEEDYIREKVEQLNPDNLDVESLAWQRWKAATGWDRPEDPGMTDTKFIYFDYPDQSLPYDFKKRMRVNEAIVSSSNAYFKRLRMAEEGVEGWETYVDDEEREADEADLASYRSMNTGDSSRNGKKKKKKKKQNIVITQFE